MAAQWHKRILSDSLELEDQIASSYQAYISRASAGSGLVISHLKDSDDREKKKKLIGLLQCPWVDFLRGEFL